MKSKSFCLIVFLLLVYKGYSQDYVPKDSKPLTVEEAIALRKENPKRSFKSYTTNGKEITASVRKELVRSGEILNFKRTYYLDTHTDGIITVYVPMTEEEKEARIQAQQQKMKEDKAIRKALDSTILESLAFVDMEGNHHDLESLKGKVVVLNFWFIQCKPCVAEFPDLNKLKAEFKGQPVEFFAVAWNKKAALAKFLKTKDLDFTVVPDGRPLVDQFKIPHYPYNIVIDKDGRAHYISELLSTNVLKRVKRKVKSLL